MLGLLAHKWNWRERRKAENKPYNTPNMVFGADVHVCWDKFARYFDIEPRIIPMETDRFTVTAETVAERIDENTICVGAILGTTFTGEADPIEEINNLLTRVKETKGWDIPIHVDAASGGFVTPFAHPGYLLVMGPGSYQFKDYLRVGLPLSAVIFVTTSFGLTALFRL